jgi:hypothetical protein
LPKSIVSRATRKSGDIISESAGDIVGIAPFQ